MNSVAVGPGQSAETLIPRALELVVQRLGEGEDIGLGRIIDRHVRPGLEGGGRGDVEDRAWPRSSMAGRTSLASSVRVRTLRSIISRWRSSGWSANLPRQAEAGIVDQGLDRQPLGLDGVDQARPPRRAAPGRRRRHGPGRPLPPPAHRAGRGGGRPAPAPRPRLAHWRANSTPRPAEAPVMSVTGRAMRSLLWLAGSP